MRSRGSRLLAVFALFAVAVVACGGDEGGPPVTPSTPPPAGTDAGASPAKASDAPVAARIPHPTTMFGHTLTDDYSWLRKKDTPGTR